jgi:transposase
LDALDCCKERTTVKKTTKETIGCDLGDLQSELCILRSESGEIIERAKVKTTLLGFRTFFAGRTRAHVVIEAGAHSRWVHELLTELGQEVTVADPRRLKLISGSNSKTDRNDAELLARLGRADLELLHPVHHRGTQAQADLAVAKARDLLVASRTRVVNSIRGTVKSFGTRLPKCEADAFHRIARAAVPETLKPAMEPLFEMLGSIEKQIEVQEKTMEEIAKRYPDVELISQPKGVGLLTAMVFMLTVEDKKRFEKSRSAGAFLGMVPRKDQSGASDKQLSITKAGDPFVRKLLVNSANYILGPFGEDSDLKRWGLKLAERGGKNAKKRAKVAVARKLAVLMHRLWVTGEVYEPLRNAKKNALPVGETQPQEERATA